MSSTFPPLPRPTNVTGPGYTVPGMGVLPCSVCSLIARVIRYCTACYYVIITELSLTLRRMCSKTFCCLFAFVVRLIIFVVIPFLSILTDFLCVRSGRSVTGICAMAGFEGRDRG
jgi:hypothetical protein